MQNEYHVGTNKPIRLKVSIQTEGVAGVARLLTKPSSIEEQPPEKIRLNPYDALLNPGWKEMTKNVIQGCTLYITTGVIFDWVEDENIFNNFVEQARQSYSIKLKGGVNNGEFDLDFVMVPVFSIRQCFLTSKVKLT